MRLYELTLPATRKDADIILSRNGYEVLGIGAYSDIYHKTGSPFVLKLFSNKDMGYPAFVEWCKSHSDSPHVPRFKSNIIRINDNYSAIRMEKLLPPTQDMKIMSHYMSFYMYERLYRPNFEGAAFREAAKQIPEDIRVLLDDLAKFIKSEGGTMGHDIKSDNIMRRGQTLVLIDLLVNEDD